MISAVAPEALAGTLEQIEALAGMVRLTHAVIVFRDPTHPRLTDAERDRLWRAFEVPIFEQVIAADGTLVAWECEAHEGLHVASPKLISGVALDRERCACGSLTPRLAAEPFKTRVAATS